MPPETGKEPILGIPVLQKAVDLMTREVAVIGPDQSVREAAAVMRRKGIGSLPVVENGSLVGIVTERDIVDHAAKEWVKESSKRTTRWSAQIREVMSTPVVTCKPTDSVVRVMDLMRTKGVRHIPICNGGHVVGMVSSRDVTRVNITQTATLFHIILTIYCKVIIETLQSGALTFTPYLKKGLAKLYEGVTWSREENPSKALKAVAETLRQGGVCRDIDASEESPGNFLFRVRHCILAKDVHAVAESKANLCPLALLASVFLEKITARKVRVNFSTLTGNDSETILTVMK
ncbi:MAG: cyclic nucleotide-binding/CBS domain-containing protein [Candidatus Bathyarchaeia archaeon]